jgi:peptidyl-prolyl cis-trans isomerase C
MATDAPPCPEGPGVVCSRPSESLGNKLAKGAIEMRTRSFLIVCATLAAAGSLACDNKKGSKNTEGPYVAKVGSGVITSAEFKDKISGQSPFARAHFTSLDKKKEFLDGMIRYELMVQEAERVGLDKNPEVQEAKEHAMVNELIHQKFDRDPALKQVPEAEMRAYYDAHKDDYVKPERIRLELVMFKGKEGDKAALDEAKRMLADLKQKEAKGNGGSFATLARVRSDDDATKAHGGDTDFKTQEELTQAYGAPVAQAAIALKGVNDISDVVRGNNGYFILKLMGRQNAMNRTFEQVEPMLEGRLWHERRSTLMEAWVKDLRAKGNVVVYDDELNKVDAQAAPNMTGTGTPPSPPGAPAPMPPGVRMSPPGGPPGMPPPRPPPPNHLPPPGAPPPGPPPPGAPPPAAH